MIAKLDRVLPIAPSNEILDTLGQFVIVNTTVPDLMLHERDEEQTSSCTFLYQHMPVPGLCCNNCLLYQRR